MRLPAVKRDHSILDICLRPGRPALLLWFNCEKEGPMKRRQPAMRTALPETVFTPETRVFPCQVMVKIQKQRADAARCFYYHK